MTREEKQAKRGLYKTYSVAITFSEIEKFSKFMEFFFEDLRSSGEYLTDIPFELLIVKFRRQIYKRGYKLWRNYEDARKNAV